MKNVRMTGKEIVERLDVLSDELIKLLDGKLKINGAVRETKVDRIETEVHVLKNALREVGLYEEFQTYVNALISMVDLEGKQNRVPASIYDSLMERFEREYRSSRSKLESKEIIVIL